MNMKILYRLIITTIFLIFSFYAFASILPAPSIGLNQSLEMYDKDGNLFYSSSNDRDGSYVSLNQVSPHFLNAVIAIEDQNFYQHKGFDVIGIARAVIANISNKNLSQGASTITQQYVKNHFLSNEKTWTRKIKEAILALRIEAHYTKEEILESYVNVLYFGDGVYGIENAAKYYFNKNANDLDILEASMLAGMINGPELYSPYDNYELTKSRQQLVLKAMAKNNYIHYNDYQNLDTKLHEYTNTPTYSSLDYFRDYVYLELENLGIKEYNGTLKVYTTLDPKLQNDISQKFNHHLQNNLQHASVILEPNSGAINVLIGGTNYYTTQYNRALYASRQMASTIKPLLYYEALRNGFHPLSKFISEKTTFYLDYNQSYTPSNYNNKYPNKEITMIEALASSDNIYAVKMHLFLGEETLTKRLASLNIKNSEPNASLALGTQDITPIDLCAIYNCIASKGIYYEPYSITKITSNNKEIYKHIIEGKKKLDESYCLVLSQLLTSTFHKDLNGTMANYQVPSTFAAKTGTSDWDSWLVAYDPTLTLVMWSGYDDNRPLDYTSQTINRQTFQDVFSSYTQTHWFKPNKDIVQIPIDLKTQKMAQEGAIYWFYQTGSKLKL